MTKRELIDALRPFDDNTPVFDKHGYELRRQHVSERQYDDWGNVTRDDEGWEVPAIAVGIAIGR